MKRIISVSIITVLSFCVSLHGQQEAYEMGFEKIRERVLSENSATLEKIKPIVDILVTKGYNSSDIVSYILLSQYLYTTYNDDPSKIYPFQVKKLKDNPIDNELSDEDLETVMSVQIKDRSFFEYHLEIVAPYNLHSTQEVIDLFIKAEIKDGSKVFLFYDVHYYGEILFYSDKNLDILNYNPYKESEILTDKGSKYELIKNKNIGKGHQDFDVGFIPFVATFKYTTKRNQKRIHKLLKPESKLYIGGPNSTDGPAENTAVYDESVEILEKRCFDLIEKTFIYPENLMYEFKKRK